jgi:hypothetical protein
MASVLAAVIAPGIDDYRRAGALLMEVKAHLAHGQWTEWLVRNFPLSLATAHRYMRLASEERLPHPLFISQGGPNMEQPATALAPSKNKLTLVRVGDRSASLVGWRHDFFEEHLSEHLGKPTSEQWCRISCMARTMFGRDTKSNREGVRRRLARAFVTQLRRGSFVVIDYAGYTAGARGEALACKIYRGEAVDQQAASFQIDRMRRSKTVRENILLAAQAFLQPATGNG